ncbi:MAG: hypothetical protein J0I86_13630, partial [Mesorhizobium sp.]|nr:hypothetical protein [Mesorhizobium sp.]
MRVYRMQTGTSFMQLPVFAMQPPVSRSPIRLIGKALFDALVGRHHLPTERYSFALPDAPECCVEHNT